MAVFDGVFSAQGGTFDIELDRCGAGPHLVRPGHDPSRGCAREVWVRPLHGGRALSAAPEDRICPVVHVRRQDDAKIKTQLSSSPGRSRRRTFPLDLGDVDELDYLDQNRRAERQTHFMAPIRPGNAESC